MNGFSGRLGLHHWCFFMNQNAKKKLVGDFSTENNGLNLDIGLLANQSFSQECRSKYFSKCITLHACTFTMHASNAC